MYIGRGGGEKEQCHLLSFQSSFSHFLCYPQANCAPWCWFPWGCFVYILGPCGSLQRTLLWGWEILLLPQCPHVFSVRGFEALFPQMESWVVCSVSLPSCSSWFISTQMWDHLLHQLPPCPVCQLLPYSPQPSSHCLATSPVYPTCLSPPLLLIWMNVFCLTPWLSDVHIARFSCSCGNFFVLNLLFSFFWLCEEAKYICLCLHLGQKSIFYFKSKCNTQHIQVNHSWVAWTYKETCAIYLYLTEWNLFYFPYAII